MPEVAMRHRVLWPFFAAAAVLAQACGGSSPSSPSGSGGVAVQGVVLGDGTSVAQSSGPSPSLARAQKITVTVQGTTLTADVSADGTFVLKGIPAGTFTLVFLVDGARIGEILITAAEGSEVKVVVQVKASVLVVVEVKVDGATSTGGPSPTSTCMLNGGTMGQGIELEGNVSSGTSAGFKIAVNGRAGTPVDVDTTGASFRCIGGAKAPSDTECRGSVKAGAKVHVSGRLDACSPSAARVAASEVKVQKG
jgi:hypothetical protein